jgi:nitroimidazol reductase NimA-like FMN-containing flavoprotein (pyridoxamine 5'-phosphate oxidase superfamily)
MSSNEKVESLLTERRNLILAGIRSDGRPHVTPNWFYWDRTRFYVSTTRDRAKYRIFSRDGRAQLVVDDPEGLRAVLIPQPSRFERTPQPNYACLRRFARSTG